jgi:hypothetical protein
MIQQIATLRGGCDNEFRPISADQFWATFRGVTADPGRVVSRWACAVRSSLMPLPSCAERRCGGTGTSPYPW